MAEEEEEEELIREQLAKIQECLAQRRARNAEKTARYRAKYPEKVAAIKKRYREKNREKLPRPENDTMKPIGNTSWRNRDTIRKGLCISNDIVKPIESKYGRDKDNGTDEEGRNEKLKRNSKRWVQDTPGRSDRLFEISPTIGGPVHTRDYVL